jgi:hypothetical protein
MAFDWARGRHPELLSGAFYRPLDTAVPHQFFASSMLASTIVYGLLGFEADAPSGRALLAPQLPPQWARARARGLPVGAARLEVTVEQAAGRLALKLEASGGPLALEVRPRIPPGAREVLHTLDGSPAAARPGVWVPLEGRARTVEVRWAGGLDVEPAVPSLEPGQPDRGVRVLDLSAAPGGFRLSLEGAAATTATIRLRGEAPLSAEGATLRAVGSTTEAIVSFPASARAFSKADVVLTLPRPHASVPRPTPPSKDLNEPTSPR